EARESAGLGGAEAAVNMGWVSEWSSRPRTSTRRRGASTPSGIPQLGRWWGAPFSRFSLEKMTDYDRASWSRWSRPRTGDREATAVRFAPSGSRACGQTVLRRRRAPLPDGSRGRGEPRPFYLAGAASGFYTGNTVRTRCHHGHRGQSAGPGRWLGRPPT